VSIDGLGGMTTAP